MRNDKATCKYSSCTHVSACILGAHIDCLSSRWAHTHTHTHTHTPRSASSRRRTIYWPTWRVVIEIIGRTASSRIITGWLVRRRNHGVDRRAREFVLERHNIAHYIHPAGESSISRPHAKPLACRSNEPLHRHRALLSSRRTQLSRGGARVLERGREGRDRGNYVPQSK